MNSMGPFGATTHSVVAVTTNLALALTLLSSPTSWDRQKPVFTGNENATREGGRKGQGHTCGGVSVDLPPETLAQRENQQEILDGMTARNQAQGPPRHVLLPTPRSHAVLRFPAWSIERQMGSGPQLGGSGASGCWKMAPMLTGKKDPSEMLTQSGTHGLQAFAGLL